MTVPTQSNYPAALDDASTLFNSYNQRTFTLSGAIDNSQTTITVAEDLTGLSPYFFIAFETGELCYVTGVNVGGYQLTVDRGILGSAQPHSAAETARLTITAEQFEQMKDAHINVQTELGTDPAGAFTDVKSRLNDIEGRIEAHDHTGLAEGVVIDAGSVDGFDAYATATANHLLALDGDSKLPASITGDADTLDGQHGSYYTRDGTLNLAGGAELTISLDAITVDTTQYGIYAVDTESDAALDNLDSIGGGSAGDIVALHSVSSARVVVIKSGINNIVTPEGHDIPLFDASQNVILRYNGTNWIVIGGNYPKRKEYNITLGSNIDVIETGIIGDMVVERDIYLDSWRMKALQTGSITVDIWQATFPTAPTNTNTITNANEPKITSSHYGSGSCSSWGDRLISEDQMLRFNVDSCATIQQVLLTIAYFSI